jgi:type IV pilus assembly protein PilC
MPVFEYQARTKEGETRSGVVETSSTEAVLDLLQQNNLFVVSVREKTRPGFFDIKIGSGIKHKDIVIFSRQLSTLFEAQIPLTQALKTLMGETSKESLRKTISEVLDDVTGWLSLSQAMSKHGDVFSGFYISLVRSGETSGKMQEVFAYLADYLERSFYLASKAKNALIYPAFISLAFLGVMVVMLVVVIPRLVSIFKETGQEVPFYTQIVISSSDFLRAWGLFVLVAVVAGIIAAWRWGKTPKGKLFFHTLQIKIPIVGDLYKKLFMARLSDNLHTLIISGIPILKALATTGEVVGNVVYKDAIDKAIEAVKGGGTISSAFEKTKEIPSMVTNMIRIGEASGKLDFILANVSKYYTREVDSLVENLVSLIEPALIIMLGLGVGLMVGAVLVPLYNMVGNI